MKPWIYPVLMFGVIFLMIAAVSFATSGSGAPANQSTDSTTTVNLPAYYVNASSYSMNVAVPAGATLELVSPIPSVLTSNGSRLITANSGFSDTVIPVNGSQYATSIQRDTVNNETDFYFVPVNGTGFNVHVVSLANTTLRNYIWVETNNPNARVQFSSLKNITWTGNIALNLNITTTLSRPVTGWSFLFGLTGLKSNINITGTEWAIIFLGLALTFMGVGYWKHSRIKYLGIFFLGILAIIYLGVGLVLLGLGIYLGGLLTINLYWRFSHQK